MARSTTKTTAPKGNEWDDAPKGDEARENPQLTEAQLDEMDPLESEEHQDQAARRNELTNRQTDVERDTGRDAISGTQNPGITASSGHTHQDKATDTDMSGRRPMRDPAAALDPELVEHARRALSKAEEQDLAAIPDSLEDHHKTARKRSAGWRHLRDLDGVHSTTMAALVQSGRVEKNHPPGLSQSVEASALYRIKRNRA